MDQQSPEYSPPEAGLVVPVFQKGDDLINAINHMMFFLTSVVASRYPATNNQLRTSSNPRQQATFNNGRDKEEHRENKGLSRVITAKAKVTCPSNAQSQGGSVMSSGSRIKFSWFKLKKMDKFCRRRS
uniref:Uncharacterized protein n=1 Tax=Tanacetum cinerariifolium TaxID=118510 RepID=A0A699SKP5_TANCI|nr:hypothetical protein [Tanacetum cinerariifolium]